MEAVEDRTCDDRARRWGGDRAIRDALVESLVRARRVEVGCVLVGDAIEMSLLDDRLHGTSCALLDDGALKCWGSNYDDQLGLGDTVSRGDRPGEMGDSLPPVDLGPGRQARAVFLGTAASAGDEHACAVLDDGSVKCWGEGGALGLGDTRARGSGPGEMGDALPTVKLFSDSW